MLRTLTSRAREDREAGFTLIEILVAMVLMAIIMSSLAVFFIGSNKSNSALRLRQSATVVADQWMDTVHSLDPTALLTKRAYTTEHAQWLNPVTGVDTSNMNEAWDTADLSTTDGPNAPLPTTPQASALGTNNKTPFLTSIYVGQCWVPSGGGDCVKTMPGGSPVSMEQVIVAVTWQERGSTCPLSGTPPKHICAYVIGSLISNSGDPTFNLNQTIIDTTPPSTPTLSNNGSLGCTTQGDTKINVNSWSQSTDASGVARYDVYAGTDNVFTNMTKVGTSPVPASVPVSGLIPNTPYFFAVVAVDTVGNTSGPQVPANTVTSPQQPFMATCTTLPDTSPPFWQSGSTLSASSTTHSVTVTWPVGKDDYLVGGYNVYRQGTAAPIATVGAGILSYVDNGLSPWTNYTYTVQVIDAAPANNLSTSNLTITKQTLDTTPPTAPTNLTAVGAPSSLQINLAWTASTDDVAVTQYRVWRATSSGGPFTQVATTTTNAYTDTSGLVSNSKYWYYVIAADAVPNPSPASNTASAMTPDTIAPNVPNGVVGTPTGVSVALTWTATTDVAPGTGVVKYNVLRDGVVVGTPTSASFTDTGLANITTYNYTVQAVDAAGNVSGSSSSVGVKTLDSTAPAPLPTLSFSALTLNSVTLSWTPSNDNVAVTGYQLYRGTTLISTQTGLTFTDSGLTPATAYTYVVKALDAAGNAGVSNTVNPTTLPDTVRPGNVTGLKGTSGGANAVTISWAAAGDNVGVVGYKLTFGGTTYSVSALSQAFSGTGALPNSSSTPVSVVAVDGAGNTSLAPATLTCVTSNLGSVTCT